MIKQLTENIVLQKTPGDMNDGTCSYCKLPDTENWLILVDGEYGNSIYIANHLSTKVDIETAIVEDGYQITSVDEEGRKLVPYNILRAWDEENNG